MDLVPSVEADAAARRNTLDQGRTKYTPPGIVQTHTAYRPRGSEANRGCGRFGGRICPLHLHASTTMTRFFYDSRHASCLHRGTSPHQIVTVLQ